MRCIAILLLFPVAIICSNIVISNDDGWAELNIRALYDLLKAQDNKVIVSAPATDQSGRGSLDIPPTPLLLGGCEFNSCPRGSPATGSNSSDVNLNYVNSTPVTSIKYGIKTLASKLFPSGTAIDIALSGPNVGVNTGTLYTQFSGTVGAAAEAAREGLPAIALSGSTGDKIASTTQPVPPEVQVYADLSANFTETLLGTSKPYLPTNVWLNVNFGAVTSTTCTDPKEFKVVLTRISTAIPFITPDDVETCGGKRLPKEEDVVKRTDGCWATVSVAKGDTKSDAGAAEQAAVLGKFGSLFTCIP